MDNSKDKLVIPKDFRGMIYPPYYEQEVGILFGLLLPYLNICVEEASGAFPDIRKAWRKVDGKWKPVRIELETRSSHFKNHRHKLEECDIIVCWINDWAGLPNDKEVISLREVVKDLEKKEGLSFVLDLKRDRSLEEDRYCELFTGVEKLLRDKINKKYQHCKTNRAKGYYKLFWFNDRFTHFELSVQDEREKKKKVMVGLHLENKRIRSQQKAFLKTKRTEILERLGRSVLLNLSTKEKKGSSVAASETIYPIKNWEMKDKDIESLKVKAAGRLIAYIEVLQPILYQFNKRQE